MKFHAVFALLVLGSFLPATPAIQLAAQNPLADLANAAKEKAAETAIEKLLNDQLPLTLNANDVYPTVANLPGGPFSPTPLHLTADQLNQPLAPGDYTINTLDFCSEYSVHAPGAGVAYVLGPYEGKAASAIGALIWRGTVQYNINPNSLQAVSWAIQSGLTYGQMPKSYQAIVDQVIPDFKSEIQSDFFANLQTTYNNLARTAKLPPLDAVLLKLGQPGQLALSAERQRAILLRQGTNDQIRDQTLFQGQQAGLYTPVKAENGPWTERVKGQVYMKLLIAGGNMATNNVMQIRVMPPPTVNARSAGIQPHLVRAAYGEPQAAPAGENSDTSVSGLMQGMLGYSQGRGAQALGQVPVTSQGAPPPAPSTPAGTVKKTEGTATVIRAGTTTPIPLHPGDTIDQNDTIETGAGSRTFVQFNDDTQLTIGENAKIKIDEYVYDPNGTKNAASYRFLEGAFEYVSGLIAKKNPPSENIETPVGCICIRGTKLIAKVNPTTRAVEVDLIAGSIAFLPTGVATAPTISAPVQIEVTRSGEQVLPLTQDQYNAIEAQLAPSPPTS
ncbi:MAG TPA: FecR family protein [Terracidiphilus sp.]|nr:FecR family protein [Terracidiphilus sp.]